VQWGLVGVLVVPLLIVGRHANETHLASSLDHIGRLTAGRVRLVEVAGHAAVPRSGVGAIAFDITVVDPSDTATLTVWATGLPMPATPNLVLSAHETTTNLVVAELDDAGLISLLLSEGDADVIVDVVGWFAADRGFHPVNDDPLLRLDRSAAPMSSKLASSTNELTVADRGKVPTSGVGAIVLGVSVFDAKSESAVTLWPKGTQRPARESVVSPAGRRTTELVIVDIADIGSLAVTTQGSKLELTIDVVGWFDAGGVVRPVNGQSLLDTREATRQATSRGADADGHGTTIDVEVATAAGLPASAAGAVVLDVTSGGGSEPSFLTVWPTGLSRPIAASATVPARSRMTTTVLTQLGDGGRVSIFDYSGSTSLDVAVVAWLPETSGFNGRVAMRIFDSRQLSSPTSTYGAGGDTSCPATPLEVRDAASLNAAMSGRIGIWIGGDGGDEVALPDGRTLVMLGDTIIGPNDGRVVPIVYRFITNSVIVVAPDGCVTPIWGRGDPHTMFDDTAWLEPDDPSHRYWPGAGWVVGGRLYFWFTEWAMQDGGPLGWNFDFIDVHLATIQLADLGLRPPTVLDVADVQALGPAGIQLGTDAVVGDEMVTVSGWRTAPDGTLERFVAKFAATDPVTSSWSWLQRDGSWAATPAALHWPGQVGSPLRIAQLGTRCWLGVTAASYFSPTAQLYHSSGLTDDWTPGPTIGVATTQLEDVAPEIGLRYYLHHATRLTSGTWVIGTARNVKSDVIGINPSLPVEAVRSIYADITNVGC
jgi:hypothetical protein